MREIPWLIDGFGVARSIHYSGTLLPTRTEFALNGHKMSLVRPV